MVLFTEGEGKPRSSAASCANLSNCSELILQRGDFSRKTLPRQHRRLAAEPGGHLKIPHPWPGQNPPPGSGGTVDDYAG